jgi:hypothetical protein
MTRLSSTPETARSRRDAGPRAHCPETPTAGPPRASPTISSSFSESWCSAENCPGAWREAVLRASVETTGWWGRLPPRGRVPRLVRLVTPQCAARRHRRPPSPRRPASRFRCHTSVLGLGCVCGMRIWNEWGAKGGLRHPLGRGALGSRRGRRAGNRATRPVSALLPRSAHRRRAYPRRWSAAVRPMFATATQNHRISRAKTPLGRFTWKEPSCA